MNQKEQLTAVLQTCDRHALRLTWAMQKMGLWLPISATRFQEFDDDEVAVLEVFSNRFGKLQDAMGAKLFPLTLEIAKEPDEFPAFIDKLNRLEKIGAIPSVEEWLGFRAVRNQFAHDYPDDSEQNAATLNLAYSQATALLNVLEQVREFTEKRV
ncbi:MAG: hypothetical protein PHC99_02190 [Methylococcales bacterium]|nr:hypothetical protein [Methylococcales bacterium]